MNKEEFIVEYGEAAYRKRLSQKADWNKKHPEVIKANHIEQSRKGGKYYTKNLIHEHTGLRGERNGVRSKHNYKWRAYKNIIAPGSQIHHEWVPETADFKGVALVEADQHMHGIIDVIEILEGKIRLLREDKLKRK